MDDAPLMGMLQRASDLNRNVHGLGGHQVARPTIDHRLIKHHPFDVLHDQIGLAFVGLAVVVDADDVGVVNAAGDACFAEKAGEGALVADELAPQQLDGKRALQDVVIG